MWAGFSDPLMDCKDCHTRHRADKLIEDAGGAAEGMTFEQMTDYIKEHGIACPECGSKISPTSVNSTSCSKHIWA